VIPSRRSVVLPAHDGATGETVRRRALLAGTLGLLAAPIAAVAQSPARVHRIGLLGGAGPTSPEASHLWGAFLQGLRDLGYVDGQNVVIEGRWYGDRTDLVPFLASELVRLPVDVIVAGTAPAPEAAKRATSTIPIVMLSHPDPVGSGLVTSLGRPGGNVTGLSSLSPELRGKQIQLLKEALPSLSRVAILSNPSIPSHAMDVKETEVAARALKMRLQVREVRGPSELAGAFSTATKERAGALVVLSGTIFFAHRTRIAELATQSRLPTMYSWRENAEAGGFMVYGPSLRDNWRRAAWYVDRILKGAKPGDLPVEQPTKLELVVNLKAASALGVTFPPTVLARADEIIR
jgi:putative ABC transport system substrate-binding protein